MRKLVYRLSVLCAFLSLAPAPVFAQQLCPGNFSSLCHIQPQNIGGAVGAFIELLLIFAVIVSLFFLVWGGVRYIMSGGDKGKIDSARGTLIAAVVGLIISLSAFFIVNLVLNFLTGQGISTMTIPKLIQ